MFSILFIIPSLCRKWGGTTTAVLNLFHELSAQGVDVELWSAKRDSDDIADEVLKNPKIRFFDSYTSWRYSPSLKTSLMGEISGFDMVHIHGMWLYPHVIAARMAKKYDVPYVISPHGMLEKSAIERKSLKKKIYWNIIEKTSYHNSSAIHCITENEKIQVGKLSSNSNCFVIPNGVDLPIENLKTAFPTTPTILFVGRMHPIKGLDRLIRSIASDQNIRLIVAGDGDDSYKDKIYNLVHELKLSDGVEFVGFVDQQAKIDIYKRSSFLAVTSHSEVKSLVALEAIAHGLPVLITKACFFDEIGAHEAGVVIDSNEPGAISEGVKEILSMDLHKASQNAHNLAKKYSIESTTAELIQHYRHLTEK